VCHSFRAEVTIRTICPLVRPEITVVRKGSNRTVVDAQRGGQTRSVAKSSTAKPGRDDSMTGKSRLAEGVTVGTDGPEAGQRGTHQTAAVEAIVEDTTGKTRYPMLSGESNGHGAGCQNEKGNQVGRTSLLTTPFIER
jgi:hypothetical protein